MKLTKTHFKLAAVGALLVAVGWIAATKITSKGPSSFEYSQKTATISPEAVRKACNKSLRTVLPANQKIIVEEGSVKSLTGRQAASKALFESRYSIDGSPKKPLHALFTLPDTCEILTIK